MSGSCFASLVCINGNANSTFVYTKSRHFYVLLVFSIDSPVYQSYNNQKEKAEECMEYVAEHGNTLPIREQALKYPECGRDMCCKAAENSAY